MTPERMRALLVEEFDNVVHLLAPNAAELIRVIEQGGGAVAVEASLKAMARAVEEALRGATGGTT